MQRAKPLGWPLFDLLTKKYFFKCKTTAGLVSSGGKSASGQNAAISWCYPTPPPWEIPPYVPMIWAPYPLQLEILYQEETLERKQAPKALGIELSLFIPI